MDEAFVRLLHVCPIAQSCPTLCDPMDCSLLGFSVHGISQAGTKSDREGEISYDIPYMWNLKRNDTNELIKQKETHRLRKQTYGCRGWGGRHS